MPAQIALNLLAIDPKRQIGVEAFVLRVVGGIKLPKEATIHVALQRHASVKDVLGGRFVEENPKFRCAKFRIRGMLKRIFIDMFGLGLLFFFSDVVLSVNNFGPLFGKRGQRRIIVVHDVWFIDEGYEGPWWKKFAYLYLMKLQARRSHQVVTVSEFSKSAIMRTLAVPSDRIKVVKNCLDSRVATISLNSFSHSKSQDLSKTSEKPYVLLIGSDRPNKNVRRVVKAYGQFILSEPSGPLIRIVGVYSSRFIDECRSSYPFNYQHKLVFDGYVERERYECLIEGSIGIIFASLYEGFGIPVVEAISKGKNCVVSKGTVCAEIADYAGIQVDGLEVDDIERGVRDLIDRETSLTSDDVDKIVGEFMDCEKQSRKLEKLIRT